MDVMAFSKEGLISQLEYEGFTHELVRIGVDEISVAPSSVLMLRARISTLG